MNINNKLWLIGKNVFLITIFYIALKFEHVVGDRFYYLFFMFSILLCNNLLRIKIKSKKLFLISYYIDILMIAMLEFNSRYIINYAFHVFYPLILIDAAINNSRTNYLRIGIVCTIFSTFKYVNRLSLESNFSGWSEALFFSIVNILIFISIAFSIYYIEEKKKIEELNIKLKNANDSLEDYNKKIEKLTLIQERNRMARELHDVIGHKITGIIMQLEMINHYIDKDTKEAKDILKNSKELAREGLSELRNVVEAMKLETKENSLVESIKILLNKFERMSGIKTQIVIEGKEIMLNPTQRVTIFRTIQEALTNSAKHSQSTNIRVLITYFTNKILFQVNDNGNKNNLIYEGNGIKGMRERIKSLQGSFKYEWNNGFLVKGSLPLEVK